MLASHDYITLIILYNSQKFDKYWTRNDFDVSEQMEENAAIRQVKIKAQIVFERLWFDCLCLTPLSAISWWPVLVVEEARVPGENHWLWASNW